MKHINEPLNCELCKLQIWKGDMAEAKPDGEPQYVCEDCIRMLVDGEIIRVDANQED